MLAALDLVELAKWDPLPKAFAIKRLAPFGEVTLFTGAGAIGKSTVALQLAIAAAGGLGSCLGLDVAPSPTVYLGMEESPTEMHWRLHHACQRENVSLAKLDGQLHVVCRRNQLDNGLCTFDHEGKLKPTGLWARLLEMVEETNARLIFLDNLAHLFGGNENDRFQVTQFAALLSKLAYDAGAAVILLAHPNKGGAEYSGSTAWLNAVRSQFVMEAGDEMDRDLRVLKLSKANYAEAGEVARFRWHDHAFVRDEDLGESTASQLASTARAMAANDAFLACLDRATEQGRVVSDAKSGNYAPKVFEDMQGSKGFEAVDLAKAMARLLDMGVIAANQVVGKYSNRTAKYGLARIEVGAQSGAQNLAQNPHNSMHEACTISAQNPHNSARSTAPSPTERDGVGHEEPSPSPPLGGEDQDWVPGDD